jgi:ATP-dependent Lhr-like helicase
VFIQRGEMWRITEIDEERSRVQVNPIEDPAGEVPSWVGQEIPVPFAVAGEVGEIRAGSARQLAEGASREAVAAELCSRYPTDTHTADEALRPLSRQVEAGVPIPADDRIVVEFRDRKVIVNACFGHKVNATIGRVLSALLGQRTGSSIGLDVDPYRIELDVPRGVTGGEVSAILEGTDPAHVKGILELSLKNSDTLKFKLAQVATKFGALDEGDRDRDRRFGRGRLLSALADTPAYDEAIREVFHEELAVEATSEVLADVQSGAIATETVGERTPIGLDGRSGGKELLAPEDADASVIETVRERLQSDRVILLCVHCTDWERTKAIGRIADRPTCPNCNSTRIAALNPWAEEVVAAVRASEKDDDQEKATRRAHRAANLVQSHGKQAVIALAARGVGPQNAARIIAKLRENEEDFYRDIIAQERQYARTKAFWD